MKTEKIKFKTKVVLVLFCFLFAFVAFFIFNPFFWGMQSKIIKQPELSKEEKIFFSRLQKQNGYKIKRFYHNFFNEGDTVKFKYKRNDFSYFLEINSPNRASLNLNKESSYNLALLIKDSILKKNSHLKKIVVLKVLNVFQKKEIQEDKTFVYSYNYDFDKDSLIEIK